MTDQDEPQKPPPPPPPDTPPVWRSPEGTKPPGWRDSRWFRIFWGLAPIVVGLAIGIYAATADDSDSGGDAPPQSQDSPAFGSDYLARQDAKLLALIDQLDKGDGVHSDELLGHGVSPELVGDWIPDAFIRDLIDIDAERRTLYLTEKGENAL